MFDLVYNVIVEKTPVIQKDVQDEHDGMKRNLDLLILAGKLSERLNGG